MERRRFQLGLLPISGRILVPRESEFPITKNMQIDAVGYQAGLLRMGAWIPRRRQSHLGPEGSCVGRKAGQHAGQMWMDPGKRQLTGLTVEWGMRGCEWDSQKILIYSYQPGLGQTKTRSQQLTLNVPCGHRHLSHHSCTNRKLDQK